MNKIQIDMVVATLPLEQKVRKQAGYQFRCPLCHDSQKKKTKKRGWIYYKKEMFVCYNCGVRMKFKTFLQQYYPMAYKDYLKNLGFKSIVKPKKQKEEELLKIINPLDKLDLEPLLSLDHNHIAYKYIEQRELPLKAKQILYYSDNFMKYVKELNIGKFEDCQIPTTDRRIVIPSFSKQGKIIGIQGRTLNKYSNCRYLTIPLDERFPNINGLDRIDTNKKIYILEGFFDSCFVANSLAMNSSDIDYKFLSTLASKKNIVFVYDNEKRNAHNIARMKKVVSNGFSMVVWSDKFKQKDINEMLLAGNEIEVIMKEIERNTYFGLSAMVKINSILKK